MPTLLAITEELVPLPAESHLPRTACKACLQCPLHFVHLMCTFHPPLDTHRSMDSWKGAKITSPR